MIDNVNTPPQFYVKMAGPKVGKAKLSVSDLAEIIRRTQQALKRIGQVLYGQESHGKGRKKKDIERQCELFVIEDDMGESNEKGEGRSFWQSASLEELAEEQDMGVVSDIDSIAALWPADDDPDALLNFVLHERGERRRAASEGIA